MDRLTQLSTHPAVRKMVRSLALPVTLPTLVRRQPEPEWQRPLLGRRVALTTFGKESPVLVRALCEAGADLFLLGDAASLRGAGDLAQARGRHAHSATVAEGDVSGVVSALLAVEAPACDALVLDVAKLGGSRALHTLLQPLLKKLPAHARLLLLTHVPDHASPRDVAEAQGVFGFAKSLAREVGRRAITVNALQVNGSVPREATAAAVAFFASDRARYVTSQRLMLSPVTRASSYSASLAGEHAFVTGAARGIGAAIAKTLAAHGANVSLVDLAGAREGAAATCADIRAAGGRAQFIPADVTKPAEVDAALDAAVAAFGPVRSLVNNAGITRDKTFAKMTAAHWAQVLDVNFEAAVNLTERVIERAPKGVLPRVVMLSSVAGIAGNFGQTNYALSKAALIGYAQRLSETMPELQVNVVAPGFIDTVLTREIPVLNREVAKQLIALLQAGEPEDIADVVAFLASPAANGFAGATLRVDGGMFIGQ